MAFLSQMVILLMSAYLINGQRPSFAGFRPIGYPELQNKTNDELGNRFGDDGELLPLPIEAKGDRDLVNRISKLPLDKQPFWYINWKALEANRQNPQKYDQRPNVFIDQSSNANQNTNLNKEQGVQSNLDSTFNTEQTQAPVNDRIVERRRKYRQRF
ncbi:unnamed protein product [Pieris brassicae]|uniref:Seminal fluid protein HACP044 n=1 Tax=Pieris brassicae TaxID=7116 RepID=A0A9P0XCQ9_PIEBR|nr:unnamed protein product [Pieris brassicae]